MQIVVSRVIEMYLLPDVIQVLYLPPYSPDFNPIEQVFAKFKALLCSALWAPLRRSPRSLQ
jgi:transposase